MRIIDIHTHVYPDAIAMKAADSIRDYYQIGRNMDGTPGMLLDRGAQAGVSQYVILPVAIKADRVDSINQFILQQMQLHPEFVGFGAIHAEVPNIGDVADNIASLGLKGIKIHPDIQQVNLDDPRLMNLYEIIEGRIPIVMHTGDYRYDYSHPRRLKQVLKAFPDLVVDAAHFGGWSIVELGYDFLKDENCYVDTSSSSFITGPRRMRELINLFGSERVLFGSDHPLFDPKDEAEFIQSIGLSEEAFENVTWRNAERFTQTKIG